MTLKVLLAAVIIFGVLAIAGVITAVSILGAGVLALNAVAPALMQMPDGCDEAHDGVVAYYEKDYAAAYTIIEPLAEEGDACAQYYMARRYHAGRDTLPSPRAAEAWYRKSADQGFMRAQYNLAHMISNQETTGTDVAEAVDWYTRAAEQGEPRAMFNLARLYEMGHGAPQDYEAAAVWYERAAEGGIAGGWAALRRVEEEGHVERE